MSRLMSESLSANHTSIVQKASEIPSQVEAKVKPLKEWYESLKSSGNFSATAVSRSLEGRFTSPSAMRDALWYAFNQEKSLKGTDKASPKLFVSLEQELLGSFSRRLLADPPQDRAELKALLSEHFPFNAQKEQALWRSWAELKGASDQDALLEMVRKETVTVMQINSLVKNILSNSHKIDFS